MKIALQMSATFCTMQPEKPDSYHQNHSSKKTKQEEVWTQVDSQNLFGHGKVCVLNRGNEEKLIPFTKIIKKLNLQRGKSGQVWLYFTSLDFPERAGDFPETSATSYLKWGPGTHFRRRYDLTS